MGERAVGERLGRELSWPLTGLAACSVLGAGIGTIAIPAAWPAVLVMTLAQLAVTALGLLSPRRPVLWASAVAVVSLGSVVLDPRLAELAYSGAVPWISLGTAMAALNLYRRAADWSAIWAGTAALVLGSASLVVVSVRAGVPPSSAVLAASVPFLVGVIIALLLHLRDAREDRVRRPELAVAGSGGEVAVVGGGSRGDDGGPVPHPDLAPQERGSLDAARRALAIVALRGDELATSTEDAAVRRTAADLRDVARRALAGPGAHARSVARIEVLPATAGVGPEPTSEPDSATAAPSASRTATSMPDLPDREREILRLVATGASNAAIGRSLYLSEATVKQYVSRLMRRFDRENRTQLALMAARWFEDG